MIIYILIKQIGDLKEILPEAYVDYSKADEIAEFKQAELLERGYTDFKIYTKIVNIPHL